MRHPCGGRGLLCAAILVSLAVAHVDATLSKSNKASKKKKEDKPVKLSAKSVLGRGLVVEDCKSKDVLREHKVYCEVEREAKQFPGDTLAYVTPWNSHGYDIAKIFGNKFTFVSPVWLQVKKRGGTFVMEGGHDIDKGWVGDVTRGRSVHMVPRVLFDGWTATDYHNLFSDEDLQQDCISTVLKFIKGHHLAGIVVEIWSQLGGHRRQELIHFLVHFGEAFQAAKKKLILVLPPPVGQGSSPGMVGREDVEALAPYVDAFSLMTYDYSSPMSPGPNSPLDWVRLCVEALVPDPDSSTRRKVLLGLNFYGNDYVPGGGGPILGSQYIDILHKHKPKFQWDSKSREQFILLHDVEVPSSLLSRLRS